MTPARDGPSIFLPGSSEWHAWHFRKTCRPAAGSPALATVPGCCCGVGGGAFASVAPPPCCATAVAFAAGVAACPETAEAVACTEDEFGCEGELCCGLLGTGAGFEGGTSGWFAAV